MWKRPDWFDRAECLDRTDVDFFPERGNTAAEQRALAICAQCKVRSECLADAEPLGIWGGMTETERLNIKRNHHQRLARARRKARGDWVPATITPDDGDLRHGTRNGYGNLACRCQPCRDAHAQWVATRRAGLL
jgi:WhiB family redox-sensing transcriptional regulator